MENLMIKAIREFKRTHKNCEIRNVAIWESAGNYRQISRALFHIEYVEEECGEYKSIEIEVIK